MRSGCGVSACREVGTVVTVMGVPPALG
jgi:hypothetical protein